MALARRLPELDAPPRRLAARRRCSRPGTRSRIVRARPAVARPDARWSTRFQVTCWSLGVLAMWVASDWPIHDIAERYNFSVHMVQHLAVHDGRGAAAAARHAGVAAALGAAPAVAAAPRVRMLSRFVPALIVFNLVLVLTHWPRDRRTQRSRSGLVHFLVHALLFVVVARSCGCRS